jgi:hypothetical protein
VLKSSTNFDQNEMAILKEFVIAAAAFALFLFVNNVLLGREENELGKPRMTINESWIEIDRLPPDCLLSKPSTATSGPSIGTELPSPMRSVAGHGTPAARISQVFARFSPGGTRKAI